jgi:molecular chaperone DnaK (HSP70)
VIPDDEGRALLPSVVRFEADGSGARPVAMGYEARRDAVAFPLTTIASVKRLMGRSIRDAESDLPYLSFKVVAGAHNTARVAIPTPDGGEERLVSPQEVSALILRRLREQAGNDLGVSVGKAVVTVPAFFDDAQRKATRDAGRLAGLDVVRIVNEPTAAALAYGLGLRGEDGGLKARPAGAAQTIAVYDLGGGTFDISILRMTPGVGAAGSECFQVLSTSGDTHLGGDDFDHALVRLFTEEIGVARHSVAGEAKESSGSEDPPRCGGVPGGGLAGDGARDAFSPETRRALLEFAERTKIRLSDHASAAVRIDLGDGNVYERTITREEFEGMIGPLVERTIASCRRALKDARRAMGDEAVSCVVMVGGATRTPLVRRRVGEFFGLEPYTALDPDQVVALGAAVQASIMSGSTRDMLLLDVVPLSLGIETVGGAVAKLIMRNSTVPAQASEMFSTSVDGQTSIKLNVLQGEREMAADCRSLGEFHLGGIPPMPAGIPKLRVSFLVDANGVLNVSAMEERSGKRASLQVVPNHGLTREEVEKMESAALEHAREDMTRHRVVDLVANARLDVGWITRQLGRVREKLEPEYRAGVEAAIERVRGFISAAEKDWGSVDANEFHRAKEELDRASVRLHEVSIAESLREQM